MNPSSRGEPTETTASELLRRFDRPGPRYTSYPTAVEFRPWVDDRGYRERLAAADRGASEPLSLYVHIPFCKERCHYCGCNVVIARSGRLADGYLEDLYREIDLVADLLPNRRRVSQLHWGGGTPTFLRPDQIEALHRRITGRFEPIDGAEAAIEIDPRVTTAEQLRLLRRLGFDRVSLGVQDTDPHVQHAIGRDQSEERTRACYATCRELGFSSVNFDLIYGLPDQTADRFAATLDTVAELRPDRLAIYSYAHVPWIHAHQKRIDAAALPGPDLKIRLFGLARRRLLAAGYEPIGMDHFALPDDELVRARREYRLHRNFMGYTVRPDGDTIGLGVSAIGQVGHCFVQNTKKLSVYRDRLAAGRLPVAAGRPLDRDDRIRADVIRRLMCNFLVDVGELEELHGIDFDDYFAAELAALRAADGAVDHGLVAIEPDALRVTERGRLFVRNVCMQFDRYLGEQPGASPVFSRTV